MTIVVLIPKYITTNQLYSYIAFRKIKRKYVLDAPEFRL